MSIKFILVPLHPPTNRSPRSPPLGSRLGPECLAPSHQMVSPNTRVHRYPWRQGRRDVSSEIPMDTASPSTPQSELLPDKSHSHSALHTLAFPTHPSTANKPSRRSGHDEAVPIASSDQSVPASLAAQLVPRRDPTRPLLGDLDAFPTPIFGLIRGPRMNLVNAEI